jgi:hypothetical protein
MLAKLFILNNVLNNDLVWTRTGGLGFLEIVVVRVDGRAI